MTKRRLLISFVTLLLILVGFNWLVGRTARALPHLILKQIQGATGADYLVVGNSLVMAGMDDSAFHAALPPQARHGPILNVGCGGIYPSDSLQFYAAAQRRFPRIPCLIMGYMFTQLTDLPDSNWSDLTGNRALFYYSDFELGLSLYHPKSWIETAQLRLTRHLPIVYERMSIWRHVDVVRSKLGSWGLSSKATTRFGKVEDFESDPYQPRSPEALAAQCRIALDEKRNLSSPVLTIIRRARESGTKVFLVAMPMPQTRRTYFTSDGAWERYQGRIRDLLESEGATVVNALDWFSDDERYFVDNLHLGKDGAVAFSDRLARIVGPAVSGSQVP